MAKKAEHHDPKKRGTGGQAISSAGSRRKVQVEEQDNIRIPGLNMSLMSFLQNGGCYLTVSQERPSILRQGYNLMQQRSLCENDILDISDLSKNSQMSMMSTKRQKSIVDQLQFMSNAVNSVNKVILKIIMICLGLPISQKTPCLQRATRTMCRIKAAPKKTMSKTTNHTNWIRDIINSTAEEEDEQKD
ncbi:hypothetical protein BCR43DRAFT_299809 [Syncephalastrum racemosum]|uniref:Uncharacterized protein n=1 Tax=Syncephalastrum racemosum TaxID=13706 RepID=A0A1X2H9R1_SYNRA|nr:hypothetical protein BCR43DRAFT_299809 [Syncephalastrum racemosum]